MLGAARVALLIGLGLPAGGQAQTLNLPPRPPGAPTGSQFIQITNPLSLTDRENWIYAQAASGNVPDFLRKLVPVTVSATINGTPHTATYFVTPDYVAIGTDADYFLQPMTPLLGQRLANLLGCTMPTRKMVNQVWTNAAVKLSPSPIPPSAEMTTVPVFAQHNATVRSQRDAQTNAHPLGALVVGTKKDVVLSSLIYTNLKTGVPKPVVIYGWHYSSGAPIQPLYNGHGETYADYSHGIRLVQSVLTVDGAPNTVTNVLADAELSALLSDEGALSRPFYPVAPMAPVILTQPASQSAALGGNAIFQSLVCGDPPLVYHWQFNGTNLAGATAGTLALSNLRNIDAGTYRLHVSNASGTALSASATLNVYAPTSRLEGIQVLTNRQARLRFSGVPGEAYALETSIDLSHWQTITQFVASNAAVEWSDPDPSNSPRRFYRARH